MSKIRVLLADDHALVRSGLRALLTAQPDIEVVGEAEDGVVVVDRCRMLRPDVVLLDLTMPGRGGIPAADELRRACPETKVLVLTMHEDEGYARVAAAAGVAGYVLKRSLATELIKAIHAVCRGEPYVTASLAKAFQEAPSGKTRTPASDKLTDRESDVVRLIALGHTNAEIAGKLHISEKTVETHRAHIFEKLHLETRADLVRFAIEHELMTS
jgi:DNA-binding NarL/FixJ family response regulator